jgi:hypothetical protein
MNRHCAVHASYGRRKTSGAGRVQHHEKPLAGTIALVATFPQTRPFAQCVGVASGAAAHCLIYAEVDFYEA